MKSTPLEERVSATEHELLLADERCQLCKQFLQLHFADHRDNLQATLTEEQKEVLERFDDCYAELNDINEREIFVYAFRLGARIAIEVMNFSVE